MDLFYTEVISEAHFYSPYKEGKKYKFLYFRAQNILCLTTQELHFQLRHG